MVSQSIGKRKRRAGKAWRGREARFRGIALHRKTQETRRKGASGEGSPIPRYRTPSENAGVALERRGGEGKPDSAVSHSVGKRRSYATGFIRCAGHEKPTRRISDRPV